MLKLDVFDINKFIQINKAVVHEVTDNIFCLEGNPFIIRFKT